MALSAVMARLGYSVPFPCRSNTSMRSERCCTSSERMVYTQPWSARKTKLYRAVRGLATLDFCSSSWRLVLSGASSPTTKARPAAPAAAMKMGSVSRKKLCPPALAAVSSE